MGCKTPASFEAFEYRPKLTGENLGGIGSVKFSVTLSHTARKDYVKYLSDKVTNMINHSDDYLDLW